MACFGKLLCSKRCSTPSDAIDPSRKASSFKGGGGARERGSAAATRRSVFAVCSWPSRFYNRFQRRTVAVVNVTSQVHNLHWICTGSDCFVICFSVSTLYLRYVYFFFCLFPDFPPPRFSLPECFCNTAGNMVGYPQRNAVSHSHWVLVLFFYFYFFLGGGLRSMFHWQTLVVRTKATQNWWQGAGCVEGDRARQKARPRGGGEVRGVFPVVYGSSRA